MRFTLLGCGASEPERAPNPILILVDTLRADRLGCYGNPRPTSPTIDALAERGQRFETAFAPAPWTLPSTASLLTGRMPARHGAGVWGEERNLEESTHWVERKRCRPSPRSSKMWATPRRPS